MRKRTPRMHASPLRYTRRHARRARPSGSFRRMRRMYPAAEPFGRVSRLQPKSARGDRLISRSSTRRQARGCRLQRSDTFPRSRHRRHADRFDGRHAADCACGQPTGRPQTVASTTQRPHACPRHPQAQSRGTGKAGRLPASSRCRSARTTSPIRSASRPASGYGIAARFVECAIASILLRRQRAAGAPASRPSS